VTVRYRRLLPLAALSAVALTLSACGGGEEDAETTGGATGGGAGGGATDIELVNEGTLTTCTHLPYEPFQFTQDGEIVGFDVDVVDEIAADIGVEQEIVDIPFETIQSGEALNAGQCDVAAAGMTINEVREENLDFSDPYFDATQALITQADSGIESLEDLSGQQLGVQTGTTGQEYAQENAPDDVELVVFEDLALLLQAVKSGQIPAAINDNTVLYDYVADNPDLEVTAEFDTGEQYGIGVRTGNEALLEQVNETLQRIREDGTYDELYEKWFGDAPSS
jgi:polar amino acid transport system substrate-binding protein